MTRSVRRFRRRRAGRRARPWVIRALALALAVGVGLGGGIAVGLLWNADTSRPAGPIAETVAPPKPAARPAPRPRAPMAARPESAQPEADTPAPRRSAKAPETMPNRQAFQDPQDPQDPQDFRSSGIPAWERFAAVSPAIQGRPMIAIVIDDLGIDRPRSARAVALPGPLTMSFLPYARGLGDLAARARGAGHEVLVHLPMEPENGEIDPGPNALLTDLDHAEILRRVRWALDQVPFHVGANNHMGSRFTRSEALMALVMGELKARGLLFIDSRTTARSVGEKVARRQHVPTATRQVFLDDTDSADAIAAQITETERLARRHGHAMAIGHPRDATLDLLAAWLPKLAERGFVLVPVTALVRQNGGA